MPSLTQDSSHSSSYFDDDPEFLKAISEVNIPGDTGASHSKPLSPPPLAQAPRADEDQHLRLNSPLDVDELPPSTQRGVKRRYSDDDLYTDEDGAHYHSVLNPVGGNDGEGEESYLASHTYGAARFGEFGEYMTRKRAKLQIQNGEVADEEDGTGPRSKIFGGLQIHVRPRTSLW